MYEKKKNGSECNDKIINEINYGVSRSRCSRSAREGKKNRREPTGAAAFDDATGN